MNPQRVVTLPPGCLGEGAVDFARAARRRGADLLELRSDLHGSALLDVDALAARVPLLVTQRTIAVPRDWLRLARWVDGGAAPAQAGRIRSVHLDAPARPHEAVSLWEAFAVTPDEQLKHVEPLGAPGQGERLLETQRRLRARFGERVTVLATGGAALPFRALLAGRNRFDYLAATPAWSAARGQRLLKDALRADRASPPACESARLGILGHRIAASRSPRRHPAPFDRIDLQPDAPVEELVGALLPFYRGLAVTSPFKRRVARHLGRGPDEAVNTLVRVQGRWRAENTDVLGAEVTLRTLAGKTVTVLGDGGAACALREAARRLGVHLEVVRRREVGAAPVRGPAIWTWPSEVALPAQLAFEGAAVAVIAYGAAARPIEQEVLRRGGAVLRAGGAWFEAQARGQRALFEEAR